MLQVVPQFTINQIFQAQPAATVSAYRALIVGPQYDLHYYADAPTATDTRIGTYAGVALDAAWPGRSAGEVVDQANARLFAEQAQLEYAALVGQGVNPVAGAANRVRSASLVWASNAAAARSASIPADVVVGDQVRLTKGAYTQLTRVTKLIADTVASSIAAAAADAGNTATQVGSSSVAADVGNTGAAEVSVTGLDNQLNYQGEAVGVMAITYTLTVTAADATTSGNAGTWAGLVIEVTSNDPAEPVQYLNAPTPGATVDIGTRGARVTLSHGLSGDDFALNDVWDVSVSQAYTAPTRLSAGTYTGAVDTTYIVRVQRGGSILVGASSAERALVTVSTNNAVDGSGVTIPVTTGVAFAVGRYGVTLALTGDDLVVGDVFTIAATAASAGAIRTLQLADSVSADLIGLTDLDTQLILTKSSVEVPQIYNNTPMWSTSETQLNVMAGITLTDSRFPGLDLPLLAGALFAHYRGLRTTGAGTVQVITDESDLEDLGVDHSDAVLSFGVRRAFSNAAGVPILALAVATDDLAGYNAALATLREREDFYRIVPLTFDREIQNAVAAMATSRSGASVGRWATAMVALPLTKETTLIDGIDALATVVDDPDAAGTQYTIVRAPGAGFVDLGVQAGDLFDYEFGIDALGAETYNTYVIDEVTSNDEIRLFAGPDTAPAMAIRYRVRHPMSRSEQAADWGARCASFGSRRITVAFPPNPGRGGKRYPSYFLACSLAALRCASAPHQGLTNAEVLDWDDLKEASEEFSDQLDSIANAGGYIVTQSPTGTVYIRKQLTTDLTDVNTAEDSATTNVDSVSYYLKGVVAPFVGRSNVVESNLSLMRAAINNAIAYLRETTFVDSLGSQVLDGTALQFLRPHELLRDHVVARMNLVTPIPLNNGNLDLVVG